jgi:hypothetical protein
MTENNESRTWIESFVDWRNGVDKRMFDVFVISIVDAGIDNVQLKSHWEMRQSPYEFVEWFGRKYDLTSRDEVGLKPV